MAFTATRAITEWSGQLYSIIYTSVPTIVVGIWDQDLCDNTLICFPKLYEYEQREENNNFRLFWVTMNGHIVAKACYYVCGLLFLHTFYSGHLEHRESLDHCGGSTSEPPSCQGRFFLDSYHSCSCMGINCCHMDLHYYLGFHTKFTKLQDNIPCNYMGILLVEPYSYSLPGTASSLSSQNNKTSWLKDD